MKCGKSSEITAYLRGEGSGEEREMLRHHFEECGPCARELRQFERTMGALGRMETVEPSAGFAGRVQEALLQAHPELGRRAAGPRFRLIRALSIAAAVLLAVTVVLVLRRPEEPGGKMGIVTQDPSAEHDPSQTLLPKGGLSVRTVVESAWKESKSYDSALLGAADRKGEPEMKEIRAAIEWLASHQDADGSWKGRDEGESVEWTGLSVLVVLGGADAVPPSARKGLAFLQARQRDSGAVGGGSPVSHAVATLALQEGAIRTKDPAIAASAARAVAVLVTQNEDAPWGDGEIAGWAFHCLRLAHASGTPGLTRTFVHAHDLLGTWMSVEWEKRSPAAQAALLRARLWADPAPDRERWAHDVARVLDHPPLSGTDPAHYAKNSLALAYFGTALLRPLEGDAWTKWWGPVRSKLVRIQAVDGSWPAGLEPGRSQVWTTAVAALILETPRRVPALGE